MKTLLLCSILIFVTSFASASTITCGSSARTASLDSAVECFTGLNNPSGSTINGYWSGESWISKGELTSNGSDAFLTSTLTSGNWGGTDVEGAWAIDSSFWSTFEEAVISIHVGHGQNSPHHFAWLISANEVSGTWSYKRLLGNGGGLSNMKLWGRGTATQVSEPSVMSFLALSLIGLVYLARRRRRL